MNEWKKNLWIESQLYVNYSNFYSVCLQNSLFPKIGFLHSFNVHHTEACFFLLSIGQRAIQFKLNCANTIETIAILFQVALILAVKINNSI